MTITFAFAAASLAGGLIGALAVALYFRPRLRRAEKRSWAQARIYYTRRNASSDLRL